MTISLTTDQQDAMQEIANVAMGQAGSLLAKLLGHFIRLSVPRINVLRLLEINEAITSMVGRNTEVSAVRQSFTGHLCGEVIVIFDQRGCNSISDLMGFSGSEESSEELLLDVSNVLSGACIVGIIDQIKDALNLPDIESTRFSLPSVLAENALPNSLIDERKCLWSHALLMEVNFTLEERGFIAHLCLLMPERAISDLRKMLDEFVALF